MRYRHELKYFITDTQITLLKAQLNSLMHQDVHQEDNGYVITSLYFDTLFNQYYDENNAGVDIRNKIRIRKYNYTNQILKLEQKSKSHSLCYKQGQTIDVQKANELMNFPYNYQYNNCDDLLNAVKLKNLTNGLKPAIIVEYNRFAYILESGNVRITFDTDIRASYQVDKFLDNDYTCLPILNAGMHILEVKYDDFLPNYLASILDEYKLNQTAFSKYYLSRLYLDM